jgi:diguanylate cyclase (GGDEF)-like protein
VRADLTSIDDSRRLVELRRLSILDTPPEPDFDDLAALAAAVCGSQVGAVNFVDDERHFTKAIVGVSGACGESVSNDVSFCAATVQTADGVLVVNDTYADDCWRAHPLVAAGPRVGSYAGVSILSRGQRVGVICAFGSESREVGDRERAALRALARQAEQLLELRRRNAALHELALTDGLTGLANRTLLFDRLEFALADRERTGGEIGVLFCDVDDFKGVNDRFGHEAGDRLLRDIAERLRGESRDSDTVARIAGDEFVVVCPRLESEGQLVALADRIAGAAQPRRTMADGSLAPGCSVGAVVARPGERPADILRRADATMYAAKATRRSRPEGPDRTT